LTTAYDINTIPDALHGKESFSTVTYKGEPLRILTMPMPSRFDPKRCDAIIQLPYPMKDVQKTLASLAQTLFVLLPIGLGTVAVASLLIVGWAISPVREITRTTAKIEAGSLGGRLSVRGRDEFAVLAETINGMLGRLDEAFSAQRTALEQLKMIVEQQRRFTADASHELKTPLSVIKAHAGLLRSDKSDPDVVESVEAIDDAADKMAALVRDLLLLARTDAGQLKETFAPCDLKQVAEHAISGVPTKREIQLETPDAPVEVRGSASGLERVLLNLLANACRHTDPSGTVKLEVTKQGSEAVAVVSDSGEGIASEHLPRIFDRFYRIDSSRNSGSGGTGLGLAICKGVVEAHHGTISVQSQVGKGTRFTIRLPLMGS
jgi:two-component system OmpR family sensor kinase